MNVQQNDLRKGQYGEQVFHALVKMPLGDAYTPGQRAWV